METAVYFNHRYIYLIRKLVCLCIFVLFATSPLFGSEVDYVPGEVLVRFKPKDNGALCNTEEKNEILSSLGVGTVTQNFKLVPGLSLIKLPQGTSVESALTIFSTSPNIIHVQPNYIYRALSTFPNDPCGPAPNGGKQWGLHNIGQTGGTPDADIDAPEVWDIATDSNIIVAVIDSGVDYTHSDLAANMWHNPGEIPDNGIDDDGNGYIDDIFGYDFYNNDIDPMDDNGHGTHCAGIIGAIGNNSLGVTGVCWNVKIMALKFLNEFGSCGSTAKAISCIEYAIEMGAKVLSNSWGSTTYDQDLKNYINAANAAGLLFISAAGNNGTSNDGYPRSYPASYDCDNIISIMATDSNDERAVWSYQSSSNWGLTSVDLAAPGSDILSCWPNGQYDYMDGTSVSAPYVAGACALAWSMNPTLGHLDVKDIILSTVDQIPALNDLCVTGGRLNLFNALAIANASSLFLDKVDDINDGVGVMPGDDIHYTISYANPITDPCDPNFIGDVNNAVITDFLPDYLVFGSASGPNSIYHPRSHTVTWNIGILEPNDSCSVTLTVKVNSCITGYGIITNVCKIEGGNWARWSREDTPVLCASSPSPTCGEASDFLCTGAPNLNLTWCPGLFTAKDNGHEVYFGTNFNEVHNANNSWPIGGVYKGPVSNPSYPIPRSNLELGTTYYWRIDEVNTAHPALCWKGSVWSFTADCYLLDNFDSYWILNNLPQSWNDYTYNGSCALVYPREAPEPVRSGWSMRYEYWNSTWSPYYSEAEADVNTAKPNGLGKTQDWLDMGATVLSLWFYGTPTNDANEQMYIKLVDNDTPVHTAKVEYSDYGDMNNVKKTSWHQWNIPLEDFTGVNLAKVAKIIIGFGDGTQAESDGIVYFEDIRLYLNKCFPGDYPVGDFEADCAVDLYDFAIFALAWLTSSGQPTYNPICDISVPRDGTINEYDLARFCDDWLWLSPWKQLEMMGSGYAQGAGFTETLSTPAPPQQPQIELQPEPQPYVQIELEPLQPEPQPQLTEEDIQDLVDWLEELWLTDEEVRKTSTEAEWLEFIEAVRQSPIE
jgi:hypothetical protein